MNLLFLCVANSARSQLAEGIAKRVFGPEARVESAGSHPGTVHPFSIEALREIGIDISANRSKAVEDLPKDFLDRLDYVITLCAEEVCPVVLSTVTKLHWPLPDPAGRSGTDAERLERFRQTRDRLEARIRELAQSLREGRS